jgi:hypothetical protein
MATSKPPTNGSRSTWGPPRDRPVASSPSPRRLHPAARARRIAGWATVASSTAIVGYMVTANAQTPTSQRVTPSIQQPAIVLPAANQDDNNPAPVVQQPNIPVATPPVVTNHNRQVFQPFPNSSTHGS